MAVLDGDLRYLHVNAALATLNELPVGAHIGRHVRDVVPPHIADRLVPVLLEVLASGSPQAGVRFEGGSIAAPRSWEGSVFPLGGNGQPAGIGILVLETTERDRAVARARYLARAGRVLGSSLDLDATLQTVAQLAVPEIADWAFVELVQPDGGIKRVAWAHADESVTDIVREYDERYPLSPDDPEGSAKVVRTGRPELLEEIPDGLFEAVTHDPEQLRILRSMGFRSTVIVPLVARGRILGDLALAYSHSGRRYGPDDLDMLSALADSCALAIDNARLFGEQERTARTLQHSLLPPQLPEIAGVEIAARYRPYGSGIEVGGDFYDVFPVPGGWALSLGDVAGKSTAAAATTALLRHTLRIAAYVERSPGRALLRLAEAVLRDGDEDHPATVVCALLQPGSGGAEVVLASAGHPPPLVRRADGTVEGTVIPGLLLGAGPAPAPPESVVHLGPGDVLVLYTDGVTEARTATGLVGEEGLAEALRAAPPTANGVAEAVERCALAQGQPRDDVAVVAVAVPR